MRFDNSEACSVQQLDLFTIPNTQSVLNDASWHLIPAEADFNTGSVIFKIQGDDTYLDLPETELILNLSIRKEATDSLNTSPIVDADKIGPTNNFLYSIFSQVQVSINDCEVENSNEGYAYHSYVTDLLNYDKGSKTSFLQKQLFYKDDAGFLDNFALKDANSAYVQRRKIFLDTKVVELKGKLKSNIFNINRFILSHTNIRVTLSRSKTAFCLIGEDSTDKLSVYIHRAWLRVRRVTVNPSLALLHATSLEQKNAVYPYKHVITKAISVANKSTDVVITNIHNGRIPNRLVVGFVETLAYTGNHKKNPFNFQHFNINEMLLKVNGFNIPYNDSLTFDFEKGNYVQAYNTLYQGIAEYPNDISMSDYPRGFSLFAFNLTPDLCGMSHFHEAKTGGLSLHVKFTNETQMPIHAIFYLEFDNILQLTKARVPIVNSV